MRYFPTLTLAAAVTVHAGVGLASSEARAAAEWMWSGAVTPTSARVKSRVSPEGAVVRLAFDTGSDFAAPRYSLPDTALAAANDRVVDLAATGLSSDTRYYYALEVLGQLDTALTNRFRTPALAPASFELAFASCASTGSSHEVFHTIRLHDPLVFLHLGDFHYQNISVADPLIYRQAYRTVLTSASQSQLYREIPIAYIWDDHDFGPNNGDSTAPGRFQARFVYQEYVPHFPLAAGSGDVAIYQSFSIGRTKFILTDSRSARSPYLAVDGPAKTMLGAEQKAWLMQELLAAKDDYALIVWANSLPWIGVTGDDGWYAYIYERREIADFIAANGITRLCMISGDAHMLAIDDGSHSDYSTSGGAGFPVMHAAALDRTGSVKGGPYSHGTFPGAGQFGLMQVTDTGDSIIVNWSGRNYLDQELVAFRLARSGQCAVTRTGDLDDSGNITVTDILRLISFVFKAGPEPSPCAAAADSDCNGGVSAPDIITLINYVFKGGPTPCNVCRLIPGVWTCAN